MSVFYFLSNDKTELKSTEKYRTEQNRIERKKTGYDRIVLN